MIFEMGQRVRCQCPGPLTGSWYRYEGKEGIVVAINYGYEGISFVEIGVEGPGIGNSHLGTCAWFLPEELVAIDEGAGVHEPTRVTSSTGLAEGQQYRRSYPSAKRRSGGRKSAHTDLNLKG
jgi:hypothetical protein